MVAQWLHNAGLPMGPVLVLPDVSNPDGHYEDAELVDAHDDILRDNGSGWDFVSDALPTVSPARYANLARIAGARDRRYCCWGFKDPRCCLLLETWRELLQQPRVLIVYRHYHDCAESLRHRAARAMALHPLPFNQLRFWTEWQTPLRMWLAHNRPLLEYARRYPADVMVVSHHALLNGYPLVARLNERFDLSLDAAVASGIKPELSTGAASTVPDADPTLIEELEAVWHGLEELSVAPSLAGSTALSPAADGPGIEPRALLQAFGIQGESGPTPGRQAELATREALGTRARDPGLLMNLGDALAQQGRLEEAIGAYRAALRLAPRNAAFRSRLAVLCMRCGQLDEAEQELRLAHQIAPGRPGPASAIAQLSLYRGDFEAACAQFEAIGFEGKRPLRIWLDICASLLKGGRWQLARERSEQLLAEHPEQVAAHLNYIDALHRGEWTQQALEHAIEAAGRFTDHPALTDRTERLLSQAGRSDEAAAMFVRKVRIAVRNPFYASALEESLLRCAAQARADLRRRLEQHLRALLALAQR